jgi:hypothetical protein
MNAGIEQGVAMVPVVLNLAHHVNLLNMSTMQRAVADIIAQGGGSEIPFVDPGGASTVAPNDASERSEDDDVEPPKDWNNLCYLKSAMNTLGLHRRCQNTDINTNTTPCIVNDPRGNLHVVAHPKTAS